MQLFLSTYINRIDKKGRVSVPAPFRSVLGSQSFAGIVVYNSFVNESIEACGMDKLAELYNAINKLDLYSEEREALATVILGGSIQLSFDSEGRISLPDHLMQAANLDGEACFVGKGETFEIWSPQLFNKHFVQARNLAKSKRFNLKSSLGEG